MTTTEHVYVIRDPEILGGEPIIKGTRTPVRAVVENWRLGVAPENITNPHFSRLPVWPRTETDVTLLTTFEGRAETLPPRLERLKAQTRGAA